MAPQQESEEIGYKDFTLSVFKDPFGRWTVNIAPTPRTLPLFKVLSGRGDSTVNGPDRDAAIKKAEKNIDTLLAAA